MMDFQPTDSAKRKSAAQAAFNCHPFKLQVAQKNQQSAPTHSEIEDAIQAFLNKGGRITRFHPPAETSRQRSQVKLQDPLSRLLDVDNGL